MLGVDSDLAGIVFLALLLINTLVAELRRPKAAMRSPIPI